MSLHIIVTAKQVIDPEMPLSAFKIDDDHQRVTTPSTFPPVINGFDEYAVEAALRIKDNQDATVTVLSGPTQLLPGLVSSQSGPLAHPRP